jgi:hypothetical protein
MAMNLQIMRLQRIKRLVKTNVVITHPVGGPESLKIGTNTQPEFPYSVSILLASLGAVNCFGQYAYYPAKQTCLTSLTNNIQIKSI